MKRCKMTPVKSGHCDDIFQFQYLSVCEESKEICIVRVLWDPLSDGPVQEAEMFVVSVIQSTSSTGV